MNLLGFGEICDILPTGFITLPVCHSDSPFRYEELK